MRIIPLDERRMVALADGVEIPCVHFAAVLGGAARAPAHFQRAAWIRRQLDNKELVVHAFIPVQHGAAHRRRTCCAR
jgi:hypothetical protein